MAGILRVGHTSSRHGTPIAWETAAGALSAALQRVAVVEGEVSRGDH